MKRSFYLSLLTCLFSAFAWGQTRQVTGRIVSDSSQPIVSANVNIKGTATTVATDNEGRFSINIPDNNNVVLVISSVGYSTQTINVGARNVVDVTLTASSAALSDVVVIGYQTVRRRDVMASISSVSAKDLKDIPINSAAEALNGRLAGVTATTSEGAPDATVRIRVRGGMSITQNNDPLYIIDGVQVENGLNTISPQDIQSIDVLKDAAATAIYGARGANGVIVITTKSGRPGKTIIGYNGFVGVRNLPKTLEVLSPYDFVVYQSERSRGNTTDSTTFVNRFGTTWDTLNVYKSATPVDWQKEVFGNTGVTTTHNLTVSGGNNKVTYNFGYTYNNEKAVVLNSNYKRHLLNAKADYKITDKLKVGVGARYSLQTVLGAGVSSEQGSSYNRLRNAVRYRPFLSPGQDLDDPDPYADPNAGNGLILVNPIQLVNSEYRKKTTDVFNITANASYTIAKNLSFRSTFGYDKSNLVDLKYSDSLTPYSVIQGGKLPIAGLDTSDRTTITNSNVLTYSPDLKDKHDFDILLGEETYELRTESRNSLFRNFPRNTSHEDAFNNTSLGIPFSGYPRLNETKYTNLSFFSRVTYAYLDKYLFSFNIRADGASKFIPGKQWGYFPAASFAWRAKRENFMQNADFINDLKFRVGFGKVGNNRIADYLFLTTYSNNGTYYYGINNQAVNGYYPLSLVNEDLQWESTLNKNLGMDISLLKGRIDLSVDVYNNQSKDLLLNVPISPTFGYTSQLQNIGKTENRGIEVQLNAAIIRNANGFNWSANFNISHNENKVVALGVNQPYFLPGASWGVNGSPADYIVKVGDPVGSMYGLINDGFYTVDDFNYTPGANGIGVYTLKPGVPTYAAALGIIQPGAIKYKDLSGPKGVPDSIIDLDRDRVIIGNPNPKFSGGLNQQFSYKKWDASVFVNFSYGNDVYNANKIEFTNGATANSNLLVMMTDRWKVVTATGATAQWVATSGGVTNIFGIAPDQLKALNANAKMWIPSNGTGASAYMPSSWAIEDGSFLRINNVTVGYTFPLNSVSALKMTKLRLYFTGSNLAVFTNYSGYDPEVSVSNNPLTPGLDYSAYPKSRSFIFGVNATF